MKSKEMQFISVYSTQRQLHTLATLVCH